MKLKVDDDVVVKVDFVDITTDVENLIDKVTESALMIIAASTIAHILKAQFRAV